MGTVETIALTMGVGWASGINLYAALCMLGILSTTGNIELPETLLILEDPMVIFASGFMGSMSGSVISNVLTTGAVSIPAMKRTGFSARYAAATEACASTGGVLMPPIMGATAFVMASFLSRPYIDIALAAVIPSVLFYFLVSGCTCTG